MLSVMMKKTNSLSEWNCERCTKLIKLEKYFLLGKYYCRDCMHALDTDSWFQEFCKDTRFRNIEN